MFITFWLLIKTINLEGFLQFTSLLTGELSLPVRQALPLGSVQVRQVIMFILQGIFLQTECSQTS